MFVTRAAHASDSVDPFSLSPEELFGTTIVSVSKTPEKLGDAAAAIYVLTNVDIMRSGATSIPEVLRLVPGVQVTRASTSSWAVSVRGFAGALTNKLLVLIDGREVYDPLFSGVYWDIQDTALEDIERIEVIRGPGASLWGVNAVNGVINIITKSAAQTKGALVSVIAGDQERAIVTSRYGADVNENVHLRAYMKYLHRAPQERLLTGTSDGDEWHAWRGGFRLDSDKSARGDTFTLQGDFYDSDTGQFRLVPQFTRPFAALAEEKISASGGNLLGRWTREFDGDRRLSMQAYVDVTARSQIPLKDERATVDVDTQYEFPLLTRNKVIVGMGYRYSVDNMTATPVITFVKSRAIEQRVSAFIQDKITLVSDRWFLTLGSKFQHTEFSGLEVQPSARIQWQGRNQRTIWASISRATRIPSALEHNLSVLTGVIPPGILPLPVAVQLVPSKTFDSETLIAYELGYRQQLTSDVLVDFSTFYNDYERLSTLSLMPPQIILQPPAHIVLPVATTNLTSANTYGFEAAINWRATEHLNFSTAYSFLYMNLYGPPSNLAIDSEGPEKQSPRQQWNLRGQWDISDRFAFDTTLYYVTKVPAYQVDDYWRVDARVEWRVTDNLRLEFVAQDLLEDRTFDAGEANTGRSIYGRITWRS